MPEDLRQIAATTAEHEEIPRVGIAIQLLLNLKRQSLHPAPHIRVASATAERTWRSNIAFSAGPCPPPIRRSSSRSETDEHTSGGIVDGRPVGRRPVRDGAPKRGGTRAPNEAITCPSGTWGDEPGRRGDLAHAAEAFLLKCRITDGKDLVNKKNIGFEMCRDSEGQADIHAR